METENNHLVDLMWSFVEIQDFGGIYTKNDFILMD